MKKKKEHFYRVIAHLADGDIEIFPMKKEHFTTFFEAYEAREEHLPLCENISIYLYEIN